MGPGSSIQVFFLGGGRVEECKRGYFYVNFERRAIF